jgi:hypothetical protein
MVGNNVIFCTTGYADEEDRRHHQREAEQESANNNKAGAEMSSPGFFKHFGIEI